MAAMQFIAVTKAKSWPFYIVKSVFLVNKKCGWTPVTLSTKSNGVAHLEMEKYPYEDKMRYRDFIWPKLVEDTDYINTQKN